MRQRWLNTTGVSVFVEEEKSADAEKWHYRESVGYFAAEPGLLVTSSGGQSAWLVGESGTFAAQPPSNRVLLEKD